MNPLHWFVNFAIRVYTRIACRIDAPDLQQKVPMQGPLIVIANHTGQLEVPLLFAHLQPRKMTGWAKIETWDNWFLHWVFNLWGAIPVRRGEADLNALRKALQALENGYIFGLAPEGTRNKTGRLRRALPGAVTIALHSGAPILPLVHWGGEKFLSNLKRLKRTDFHIRVGEPFRINTNGVRVTAEIRRQIVDEMMYLLASMLPEEYRGEYSDLSKATRMFIERG
jgi:1-acyl-sn-glycerol-3-phosphate acyltransferase